MTDRFEDYETDLDSQSTFEDALEELKTDNENLPSPAMIVGLSGLSPEQLNQLAPIWDGLSTSYRRILMQMLVDASASNFVLDFRPIGFATLNSAQADVRQAAIELLAEDESMEFLHDLLYLAQKDDAVNVRAEAVKSLGRFVLMGEMGDLRDNIVESVQNTLLKTIGNAQEDIEVRRFAIESIANCTRDGVSDIITEAYRNPDPNMRLSAVIAMGHSCDEQWENQILEELSNKDDECRIAAIRAAGEIQLDSALQPIIKNIEDGERDEQEVAIWSLGEIGGKEAVRTLESLMAGAEDAEDADLIEKIDDAIGNASLMDGNFMMVDFTNTDG